MKEQNQEPKVNTNPVADDAKVKVMISDDELAQVVGGTLCSECKLIKNIIDKNRCLSNCTK